MHACIWHTIQAQAHSLLNHSNYHTTGTSMEGLDELASCVQQAKAAKAAGKEDPPSQRIPSIYEALGANKISFDEKIELMKAKSEEYEEQKFLMPC